MLEFLNKDFKSFILNMFTKTKETMSKELEEWKVIVPYQIEIINKDIEIIKRDKLNQELEITITEMKNPLEHPNSRFEQAEDSINEFEDRSIEIILYEEPKK